MKTTAGSTAIWKSFGLLSVAILLLSFNDSSNLQAEAPHSALSRSSLSTGCGKPSTARASLTLASKDGNGTTRKYLLELAPDYNLQRTYSLIFVFHGLGGSAEGSRAQGLQYAPGAAAGGIFVFPQGIQFASYGIGWDDSAHGYDMPFFDAMVREVESSYCIDKDEVFVAGFSWGGDFSTGLACERGETIRAVAVNSATDEFKDKADYRTYQNWPCPGRKHPAVRFEHAADADVAYPAPDFASTSKLFQSLNHCSATMTPVPSSTPVMTCHAYQNCAVPYIECPFNPSIGHTFPPNWPQDTWAFFNAFRKPDRDSSHYRWRSGDLGRTTRFVPFTPTP